MNVPIRSLIASAFFATGIITALSACSKDDSNGEGTNLSVLDVVPAPQGCPDGYQHPKICCDNGGDDHLANCLVQDDDPFAACPGDRVQYDDGSRCCAGDDLSQCLSCNDG